MEYEKIREIIAGLLSVDVSKINEKTSFTKDLGMDSLDVFQLIAEIEDAFDIDFPPEAAEKIKTVRDAAEYAKRAV